MIIGGLGAVAKGLLKYMDENPNTPELKGKHIVVTDILEEDSETAIQVISLFKNLDIEYKYFDFKRDLSYFWFENNIDTVIHLAPESSTIIFKESDKMPWQMKYIDASIYLTNFNNLKYVNHNLLSNFNRFDEIKNNYKNIVGSCSNGMDPGVVFALFRTIIQKHGTQGLKAAYVVEKDRINSSIDHGDDTFDCSWAPSACLQEMIEEGVFFRDHTPYIVKAPAAQTKYKFRFGDDVVYGGAVIHEECFVLSKKFPIETTFLYSLRDTTLSKIDQAIDGKVFDNYHVYSPLTGETLTGDIKLGMMCVYEDKEVILYNIMDSSDTVSSGTTKQVSAGVYAGLLSMLHFQDRMTNVTWLDDYLEDDEYLAYYNQVLSNISFDLIELVNPFSDGLLADRAKETYECKALPKIKQYDKKKYLSKDTFSFDNTYWSYIEEVLLEDGESIQDINTYCLYFINKGEMLYLTCESEDEFFDRVIGDYQEWIVNYKKYNHKKDISITESNIHTIPLSYIEEVLLDEGEDVHNINRFLMNDLQELDWYSTENSNDFYQNIWNFYVKKEYV
jgi:hypothetical protein